MGEKMITLTILGEEKQYPSGISFRQITKEYQSQFQDDIVLVLYNNRLRELAKTAKKDGNVEIITTADKIGRKAYRRSVTLLMQKAVHNLWGEYVEDRDHVPCSMQIRDCL